MKKKNLRLMMQDVKQKTLFAITLKFNEESNMWEYFHEGVKYTISEQD